MNDLFLQLRNICNHNRDGSYVTQKNRLTNLELFSKQLHEMGFRRMKATSLREKHVNALVNRWLAEQISPKTIHNRMSFLRWWAQKISKTNVVHNNSHYGIPKRDYNNKESKAQTLDEHKLARIEDEYVKASLQLQAAFGLRREESIKFIPNYADQGNHIRLKASWCKGGKARTLPIRHPEQRAALEHAKTIAGNGSLIPSYLNYVQQQNCYEKATARVGLNKMHGLRHQYAQQRYQELTGWACSHCGGLTAKELTPEQREVDKQARLVISKELGHERLSIVATYCGV